MKSLGVRESFAQNSDAGDAEAFSWLQSGDQCRDPDDSNRFNGF